MMGVDKVHRMPTDARGFLHYLRRELQAVSTDMSSSEGNHAGPGLRAARVAEE